MIAHFFYYLFGISELKPVEQWHTNAKLRGIKKGDVVVFPDLPVTQLGDKVISIWHTKSFWVRIKFLLTGKVNFQILAPTHRPIAISIGEYERPKNQEETKDGQSSE